MPRNRSRAACLGLLPILIPILIPSTARASDPASSAQAAAATKEPGKEKLAVLVLGTTEKDAELADNLTEVIIASIAQRRGVEMAGREEFRARLGVESELRSQACIDDLACLGRAAVSLGVRRIVAGTVGIRGKQYLFNLNLNNLETNRVENHIFRLVEGGVSDLISAVQTATQELFRPRIEPGRIQLTSSPAGARVSIDNAYLGVSPLISGTLLAGKHTVRVEADGRFPWVSAVDVFPGQDLGVNVSEVNLPRRRAWPSSAATGSAVIGGLGLAVGGFLGVLSQLPPSGATHEEAQDDFRQKQRFGTAANVAFVSGAVFGAVALALVVGYHEDIFGRSDARVETRSEAPPDRGGSK
jgi:PEGA domain